jgi:hypothetical protein
MRPYIDPTNLCPKVRPFWDAMAAFPLWICGLLSSSQSFARDGRLFDPSRKTRIWENMIEERRGADAA